LSPGAGVIQFFTLFNTLSVRRRSEPVRGDALPFARSGKIHFAALSGSDGAKAASRWHSRRVLAANRRDRLAVASKDEGHLASIRECEMDDGTLVR
jgi:hypothetical protein